MKKWYLCFMVFFLSSLSSSYALVGTGGYVPFAGKWQTDKVGGENTYSFNPFILIHHRIQISGRNYFKPAIGLVFHTGVNEQHEKRTFFVLYNFSFAFYPNFFMNYGFGTFLTSVSGKGSAVSLQNGSSTATFYQPSVAQVSYNTTLNLGVEFFFHKKFSIGQDNYLFSFLSSAKRSLSYSLSLNYYL